MIRQMSARELAAKIASERAPRLLDVREPEEHDLVSLRESTLIPLGDLVERAGEIEHWKEEEIVVYCHHGLRSLEAIRQLKELGFSDLWNLAGGIDAWAREVDSSLVRY